MLWTYPIYVVHSQKNYWLLQSYVGRTPVNIAPYSNVFKTAIKKNAGDARKLFTLSLQKQVVEYIFASHKILS